MKIFLISLSTRMAGAALLAVLAILSVTQTRVAASSPVATAATQVEINNFSFAPATVTVSAGTTVTWINRDEIVHNVVSSDKTIKSEALDTDDKFTFTFTKPGTYSYICTIHPRMKGTVIVQ
jgi:amicyanin